MLVYKRDTGAGESISKLISFGFSTIIVILLILGFYIFSQLQALSSISTRVNELRTPTFEASAAFSNNVNKALSSLRGDILLENETQHINYQESWSQIYFSLEQLKELSVNWTNPENNNKLIIIEDDITILANSQSQILFLLHNHQRDEAIQLLSSVAAPTSENVLNLLSEVVDNQKLLLDMDNEVLNSKINSFKTYLFFAFLAAVIFSAWLARRIYNSTQFIENQIATRNRLIDQNILIASLAEDGTILEISNQLCRELGGTRKEFIGTQSSYFLNDDTQIEEIKKLLSTNLGWAGEIERKNLYGESKWFSATIIPPEIKNNYNSGHTIILENISDKKHNEMLSITDELTGIFNRRHFDNIIEKEMLIARRRNSYLSLAVIDIDFFKNYNDKYGHPMGDTVLRLVAQTINKTLNRPDDYAFRLGGEEFGVLFSSSDIEQSMHFLEKIRETIEDLEIKHSESSVAKVLTISIGAVCAKGKNLPSVTEFYSICDNALYEAKEKRNKVEIIGL